MSVLEQVAVAWQALLRTLAALTERRLWGPWLVLGAAQAATLALLVLFAHPWLSWAMAPLVRWAAGEAALHYPGLMLALPGLYARADMLVGGTLGAVMVGAGTVLFASRFRGFAPAGGEAFARAGRCAVTLVLAQLPYNLLVAALGFGVEVLLGQGAQRGLAQKLVFLGVLGGTVILQSLFLYVAALVVLERRGALEALRALPRAWARGFWAALFLGAPLLVPLLPLQMLLDQAQRLVERGDPDLVAWVVGLQALVGLVAWTVLVGSATLVYLSLVAERPEEAAT